MDHDNGVTNFCVRPRGNSGGVKCGRWNPTAEQVKVLMDLFRSGLRTPSTDQIQKISSQLSFYGKIESKNVFYWFQNHKARERQKRRRVSVSDHNQYHHQEVLREEKIAFTTNYAYENQVSEPERSAMETLQLFPLNSLNDSVPEKFRIYANEWKENSNSISYSFGGEKFDHPPLDLRLSFV